MSESKASLRFDHREIAVIFSLFIFVSLLMFTVGILVGKGLAQAKYESVLLHLPPAGGVPAPAPAEPDTENASDSEPVKAPSSGTSVSTDTPNKELKTVQAEAPPAEKAGEKVAEKANEAMPNANPAGIEAAPKNATAAKVEDKNKPLELVPKNGKSGNLAGTSLRDTGKNPEADDLLKNPKLRALVDNEGSAPNPSTTKRSAASTPPAGKSKEKPIDATSQSLATGPFTVQVGSYPTEKDATERVEALKKLGFSHSYFSAKQWTDTKETWYRVWLGYYPDYESAKRSGRTLQERGEVTNYLVRKTDAAK